ncbi:MAG: hypothetical protein SWH68_16635 [Thermodesulfobacteriota bacterium]|nr:hypothetical protein [Thermodesulfobacteriota bacterium]
MKLSVIGFIFWIVAGVIWGFKMISNVMANQLEIFTIEQIAGTDWISAIPWEQARPWALVLAQTYLWFILLAIGLVFIVAGMFTKQ